MGLIKRMAKKAVDSAVDAAKSKIEEKTSGIPLVEKAKKLARPYSVVEKCGERTWLYCIESGTRGSWAPDADNDWMDYDVEDAIKIGGCAYKQDFLKTIKADTIELTVTQARPGTEYVLIVDDSGEECGDIKREKLPFVGTEVGGKVTCAVSKPPFCGKFVSLWALQTAEGLENERIAEKKEQAEREHGWDEADMGVELPDDCYVVKRSVQPDDWAYGDGEKEYRGLVTEIRLIEPNQGSKAKPKIAVMAGDVELFRVTVRSKDYAVLIANVGKEPLGSSAKLVGAPYDFWSIKIAFAK